jgi:DNA repair photolyase
MIKIKEIKAKTIITRSGLPDSDYVINPYVGCMHGCIYCYARFMKRFTGHTEPWGQFVDVKTNGAELIPKQPDKYKNKGIIISSVTDPYQPLERKYGVTRKILEKLIPLQPSLCFMSKSDLITRDIDLLTQFKDCVVAVSLSTSDDKIRRILEPLAATFNKRCDALKELHQAGIKTVLFISPIFPGITDWRGIIDRTGEFVDEYCFENLNLYPMIRSNIFKFLRENRPELIAEYNDIYSKNSGYWYTEEDNIKEFGEQNNIKCKVYFHHRAISKKAGDEIRTRDLLLGKQTPLWTVHLASQLIDLQAGPSLQEIVRQAPLLGLLDNDS